MNILYINHYAGGPAFGMEYRPYYLAREWVRMGHSTTVVAASQSHVRNTQPNVRDLFTRELIDGIHHVWCKTPAYHGNGLGRVVNIWSFLRGLRRWNEWLKMTPDIVIASSTYPLDIYPAQRIARAFGAKLVWEVHDLWPLSPIELGGMSRLHPFILLLQRAENFACRTSDRVVSMLPNADRHLREHGMSAEKFLHIPNGIDPAEWNATDAAPLPSSLRSLLDRARCDGLLTVAYAGAHGVANALGSMLDAARLTTGEPIAWILIGNGPEKAGLAQRIRDEGLSNVTMIDAVDKAAIPAVLRAIDVLYIGLQHQPLFRFGISPNKLMDYMMAAKPIICAIDAGNDPVSDAGCGLTIAPEIPEALAAAARRMLALPPADRAAMGSAGRRYVEANHLYPVLARKFADAMNRLL